MSDRDTAPNGRANLMQIGKPTSGCGCGRHGEGGHSAGHGHGHHSTEHFQAKLDGPTSAEKAAQIEAKQNTENAQ